jgi:hypothetical protein
MANRKKKNKTRFNRTVANARNAIDDAFEAALDRDCRTAELEMARARMLIATAGELSVPLDPQEGRDLYQPHYQTVMRQRAAYNDVSPIVNDYCKLRLKKIR